jgi:hypothetical protein
VRKLLARVRMLRRIGKRAAVMNKLTREEIVRLYRLGIKDPANLSPRWKMAGELCEEGPIEAKP